MKIQTKTLTEALTRMKSIVGRKNTLPVLSSVKIDADNGGLEICGTDLDQYQTEQVECSGKLDAVCVNLNYLMASLGGESAEIKNEKDAIIVKCAFGTTKIATLEASEFPVIPDFKDAKKHGTSCPDLEKAVSAVSWAASQDQSRYNLNCVSVSSKAQKSCAVATCGRNLAVMESALIGSDFEILIPNMMTSNLCSALAREGSSIASNDKNIKVEYEGGWYSCKQVDATYPNWRTVMPATKTELGRVSREAIAELLSRCICFTAKDEARGVFKFSKTGLLIDFIGDNSSLSHTLDGKFSDFEIALNIRSLLKIVQQIKADELTFYRGSDALEPMRIDAGELTVITTSMRG